MGPEPTLLSRKEVDALYETLHAILEALRELRVEYIVTGGSLLGAIRQHSILFCDDDIDIAIIERACEGEGGAYERVRERLGALLGEAYIYSVRPWPGGDKVRPRRMTSVFIDIFTIRRFDTMDQLSDLVGWKANGKRQSPEYVSKIVSTIKASAFSQGESAALCPFYHFNTRKAVEMWPKEVYREHELFPLAVNLDFGPLQCVCGPRMPVLLLKRAFGADCFEVYYQSASHHNKAAPGAQHPPAANHAVAQGDSSKEAGARQLPPKLQQGGAWESGGKALLLAEHFVPMQPVARKKRRPTTHCRDMLSAYLVQQSLREAEWRHQHDRRQEGSSQSGQQQTLVLVPATKQASELQGGEQAAVVASVEEAAEVPGQRRPLRPSASAACGPAAPAGTPADDKRLAGEPCQGASAAVGTGSGQEARPRRTVYMDGVFDLFHVGHLRAIQQCARLGDRVIIGVTGDKDATGYKRRPIIGQDDRVAVVSALREVDHVLCPCPLVVTRVFMESHDIDLVVHGFASEADMTQQQEFFAEAIALGKFKRIQYYAGLSTTSILEAVGRRDTPRQSVGVSAVELSPQDSQDSSQPVTSGLFSSTLRTQAVELGPEAAPGNSVTPAASQAVGVGGPSEASATQLEHSRGNAEVKKPQWFGAAVAAATDNSPSIPTGPFPLWLREVVEPHVSKARKRREAALAAIRLATGPGQYDEVLRQFSAPGGLLTEGEFTFDAALHPLRQAFTSSSGLEPSADLSRIHEDPGKKLRMLHSLTKHPLGFHRAFDRFVRDVCAPVLAARFPCEEIYYQAFPCVRVVEPGGFSIGPHADVAYGHHPCSVNFYVPLTPIGGTSALYLESAPGQEDWHPIAGDYATVVKHFAGAICAHWTTENKTPLTRVSLDFRLVPGPLFGAVKCGGSFAGGQLDVYRARDGYYSRCRVQQTDGQTAAWERDGNLQAPDARVGFPWTVKDWDKLR